MRTTRLLDILLLLQERDRMTSRDLAAAFGVTRRTILRDIDALREMGLPIRVHRGAGGGIALDKTPSLPMAGLTLEEAEALGVILNAPLPALRALGLEAAAGRARTKLLASLPDAARNRVSSISTCFVIEGGPAPAPDPRIAELAEAVRTRRVVRLRARSAAPQTVYPATLTLGGDGWALTDARAPNTPLPLRTWGDIEITSRTMPELDRARPATHEDPS